MKGSLNFSIIMMSKIPYTGHHKEDAFMAD